MNESGEPKEKYRGQEGYALFTEEHYAGAMQKAFQNVSAVLNKYEFNKLGWRDFHGSVDEFRDLKGKILDKRGVLRKKYMRLEGYVLFAEEHYAGAMQKAFMNVSAVLGGSANMKNLGLDWKCFFGTVFEYQNLVRLFKNNDPLEFQGLEGQKRVAKEIFEDNLRRTYTNVSVLKEYLLGSWEAFKDLGWSSNL